MRPVCRDLHVVPGRTLLGIPVQRDASILAQATEVECQPGQCPAGAAPDRCRIAIEHGGGAGAGSRLGCGHGWGQVVRRDRPERRECQRVDPHRPATAAGTGGDRKLDRRRVLEVASTARAPGEGDLPLANAYPLPVARPLDVALDVPPHVLAAGVDQLEFEGVRRKLTAHPEGELVILREREIQLAPGDRIAATAHVHVETHGLSRDPAILVQFQPHAFSGNGAPPVERLEIVDHVHLLKRRRGLAAHRCPGRPPAAKQQCRKQQTPAVRDRRTLHPFTLPTITPWM